MESTIFNLHRGSIPLLVSIPHCGIELPDEVRSKLSEVGLTLRDTDWHLEALYAFAKDMGASMLVAHLSRYAIDLNRAPGGESLYPGQTTTSLCPTESFRGEPLYKPGCEPDQAEIGRRRTAYWMPYHDALRAEIERLRSIHGQVLVWEAHSIATVLPRLFDGVLPHLNLGTNDGKSCAPEVLKAVLDGVARDGGGFTHVVNGRFKGGYITRHYGQIAQGVHTIQLEMCQHLYMNEEPPFEYLPAVAAKVRSLLTVMLADAMKALTARQAS